jgi:hypothetical protein
MGSSGHHACRPWTIDGSSCRGATDVDNSNYETTTEYKAFTSHKYKKPDAEDQEHNIAAADRMPMRCAPGGATAHIRHWGGNSMQCGHYCCRSWSALHQPSTRGVGKTGERPGNKMPGRTSRKVVSISASWHTCDGALEAVCLRFAVLECACCGASPLGCGGGLWSTGEMKMLARQPSQAAGQSGAGAMPVGDFARVSQGKACRTSVARARIIKLVYFSSKLRTRPSRKVCRLDRASVHGKPKSSYPFNQLQVVAGPPPTGLSRS